MNINFTVNKQELKRTDTNLIADNSMNYVTLSVTFSEDWNDLVKFALFKTKEGVIQQNLVNNQCIIPYSVLKHNQCVLSIYGANNNTYTRITTNSLRLWFERSNYTKDIHSVDPEIPDTDVLVYVMDQLDNKSNVGHTHVFTDIIDFNDKVELEIKKALQLVEREIRTYGGE